MTDDGVGRASPEVGIRRLATIDIGRVVAEHRWLLWAWFAIGLLRAALAGSGGHHGLLASQLDAPNGPGGPTTVLGGVGAAGGPPPHTGPPESGPDPNPPPDDKKDWWDDFVDWFYGTDVTVDLTVGRKMVKTAAWSSLQAAAPMAPGVGEAGTMVEGGKTVNDTLDNVAAHNQRNADALNRDWVGTSHLDGGED